MAENKNRLALRMKPDTKRKIDQWCAASGCRSMNQFVEQAVNFYADHLSLEANNSLPRAVSSALDGRLGMFEDRLSSLLYKQAVELDMVMGILADSYELPPEEMRRRRADSVLNVKQTNGRLSFEQKVRTEDEAVRLSLQTDEKQVDEIVDQMARLSSVKSCYEKWLELQRQVNEFYSGKPMEQVPLSQQKEFRAIHNAVIQAAVQMGQFTFEDKSMEHNDEPDDVFWHSDSCRMIWSVLCDDSLPLEMKDEGVARLRSKAESGEPLAQLLLGRLYRDGPMLTPDWVEARYWFERAAHTLPDAQYVLGKLLLTNDPEVHDREQGLRWLTQAAENGHDFAAYRLGKELLKDRKVDEALTWLKASAEADNPYAEYLLGKLLWEGADIPQDKEQAVYWLGQAAEQGHSHAQLLLERQSGPSLPSAVLAVNGLLQQMGRIFQDNIKAMDSTRSQHTDHKLRRKIQEKKIAMGHKADDYEEQGYVGPAM